MRIGINAITAGIAGINTYLINLIEHLAKIDCKNEYFIYTTPQKWDLFAKLPRNFVVFIKPSILASATCRVAWEQLIFPFILKQERVDVLFSPTNTNPLLLKMLTIPSVLVIHTNLPWLFPNQLPSKAKTRALQKLMRLSIMTADSVIVPSQVARQELIEVTQTAKSKVKCVYHGGAGAMFCPTVNHYLDECKGRYGISRNYILCVAHVVPYKNLIRLIKAYNILKKSYLLDYQLVIIGKLIDRNYCQNMLQTIKMHKLGSDVIFINFVPYEELPQFYRAASLYVFPSYCEVFGLTPIEAMACGIPVVTSNVSAMPEISVDAALYFDPYDVEDMANTIFRGLNDKILREKLIKKGFERARHFSWEKTARKTLTILEDVYRTAR
jgi:glycosyltransferase involved in cell wall biosynthesis